MINKDIILMKLKEFITRDVIILIIFFLIIGSSIIDSYKAKTDSMSPTINENDMYLANKIAYSLRIPFVNHKLFTWRTPKRGDIISFRNPKNEKIILTKRIIALPGEEIEIRNKRIFIDGKELKRKLSHLEREFSFARPDTNKRLTVSEDEIQSNEDLVLKNDKLYYKGKIVKYHVTDYRVSRESVNDLEYTVKTTLGLHGKNDFYPKTVILPNHYFIMGDNRSNTNDSRLWGQLGMENIEGKLILRWLAF